MDCQAFQHQLHDWLDATLDAAASASMAAHAGHCRACASALAGERHLRAALRALPVPPIRAGFASEAMRVARLASRGAGREGSQQRWLFALAGAAAASACFAVVLVLRDAGPRPSMADASRAAAVPAAELQLAQVSIPAGSVEPLRLRIESPRDFTDVRFSVELPERVWLAGQPGLRALTWQGQLRKGPNMLELPLVAEAGAAGSMHARVAWGDFEQRIAAPLVAVRASQGGGRKTPAASGGT